MNRPRVRCRPSRRYSYQGQTGDGYRQDGPVPGADAADENRVLLVFHFYRLGVFEECHVSSVLLWWIWQSMCVPYVQQK
jgi:hypothetical protein